MSVHALKPVYSEEFQNASKVMNMLRREMHDYDVGELAEAVGVTKGCIYRIRSGGTTWPRPTTFFSLIRVLGLKMYLRK